MHYIGRRSYNSLKQITVFGLFTIYFLSLFAWYPFHNTLPGLSDTIYNITIFNDYWNRIGAFISGEAIGNSIWPEKMMQLYLEPYFGQAGIYIICKFLVRNDFWTYALFLSTLYALTAFGAFVFYRFFFKNQLIAAILGLCFASSSFLISQMELLNGIAWFPFFLSLTLFLYYRKEKKSKFLYGAAILSAIQVYFSPYITVYLGIILLLIFLWDAYRKSFKIDYKEYLLAALLGVVIIFPYVYFVLIKSIGQTVYNHFSFDLIGNFSFQVADFFRSLPHNWIYEEEGFFSSRYSSDVIKNQNSGFIGVTAYLTAFLGLFFKNIRVKKMAVLFIVIGLILSVGPFLQINDLSIPMPLYLVYKFTFLTDFFRVSARAFSLFIIGILLLSGICLSTLAFKGRNIVVLLFGFFFIIENIPLRDDYHSFLSNQLTAYKPIVNFLKNEPELLTVAHLPSSLYSGKNYSDQMLSEFKREYLYAYWQTKHKENTINGPCNFCPQSRMTNNYLLMNINDSTNLQRLILENNLDYIFYHPRLILDNDEQKLLNGLLESDLLKPIIENDSLFVFRTQTELR